MLVPREIIRRTERLEVVRPRTVSVPERKERRAHSTRTTRKLVEAGPNAPQLKRLIQHPYRQELSRPVAGPPWRTPLAAFLSLVKAPLGTRRAVRPLKYNLMAPPMPPTQKNNAAP